MIEDLLRELIVLGCSVAGYADDLHFLLEGNFNLALETLDTQYLDRVVDWGNRVDLEVSPGKTISMLLKGFSPLIFGLTFGSHLGRLGMYVDRVRISRVLRKE